MASYLQIENVSKSYGTKVLFDKISFNINEGDKIALIAPNGTGKSSLLSILAGKDNSDRGGEVKFLRDISIAFLEQSYEFNPENTIFEEVFSKADFLYSVVKEYEEALGSGDRQRIAVAMGEMDRLDGWTYEQSIKQVLSSLELLNLNQKMSELSGGEVKRVAIAGILLKNPDFLILDEPTNHLDIEIIEFLEDYLKKSKCTVFMVTHDRYFLDRICNAIFELDEGKLYSYKGNYSSFLEKREERIANMAAETDRAKNLYRKELEWIRTTPCARTGKAKYRVDAFYDLKGRTEGKGSDKQVQLNVQASRLGGKIINCSGVSHYFGERCMLADFTYNFARFEKIGIVGGNGIGKSTFLNIITGKLEPSSGVVDRGETLRIGYYHQSGISFLPNQTVFDVVHDVAETVILGDGNSISATSFLNYFLFPPNTHNTKVERLSGGEKRRLYLLTILMRNPNFLILDEPTNDLDILTLNVLEDYLINFKGSVIIVSHDRYFLDKVADHIFIFQGNGIVKDYVGKCTEYRQYMKDLRAIEDKSKVSPVKAKDQKPSTTQRKLSYKERRELEQIEKDLEALNSEKISIEKSLSSGDLSPEDLVKYSERIGTLIEELDEKELRWLELDEI